MLFHENIDKEVSTFSDFDSRLRFVCQIFFQTFSSAIMTLVTRVFEKRAVKYFN